MTSDGSVARRRPTRRTVLVGGLAAVVSAAAGCRRHQDDHATATPTATPTEAPTETDAVAGMLARRPFVVAHRGGDADWPEMSLLAYRSALAAGVDAVELSLARTSDGVWFGLHDPTLDRTSGTSGYRAADHTWAEISALRIAATPATGGAAQPYARLEDVVGLVDGRVPVFVDPKSASVHADELLTLLHRLDPDPARRFVAKGEGRPQAAWGRQARAAGLRSWGFYYGRDLTSDPTQLSVSQDAWTMLGLDLAATTAQWTQLVALGRPVVAHVLSTAAQRAEALARGAAGLMASDVRTVLGAASPTAG